MGRLPLSAHPILDEVLFWAPSFLGLAFLFCNRPIFNVLLCGWPIEPSRIFDYMPLVFTISLTACVNFNSKTIEIAGSRDLNLRIKEKLLSAVAKSKCIANKVIFLFIACFFLMVLYEAEHLSAYDLTIQNIVLFLFLNCTFWFVYYMVDMFQSQLAIADLNSVL